MEEYEDLDLTIEAFIALLDEIPDLNAGIVLQAYLPDTFDVAPAAGCLGQRPP